MMKTNDEVTLIFNCNNRQLQFEHHRTKRLCQLSIDLQRCSLRWKILIELSNRNDSV